MESHDLYTIGKLSKLVGLSTDTLRFYAEKGLLTPAYVSDETGYRYYTQVQATELVQVLTLRGFGFPLSEVRALLTATPDARLPRLRQRYAEIVQERKRLQGVARQLAEQISKEEAAAFSANNHPEEVQP